MSVISKKNPILSEVGDEFRRYSSDREMRELERSRRRYDVGLCIEFGATMEQVEAAKKAVKKL